MGVKASSSPSSLKTELLPTGYAVTADKEIHPNMSVARISCRLLLGAVPTRNSVRVELSMKSPCR